MNMRTDQRIQSETNDRFHFQFQSYSCHGLCKSGITSLSFIFEFETPINNSPHDYPILGFGKSITSFDLELLHTNWAPAKIEQPI